MNTILISAFIVQFGPIHIRKLIVFLPFTAILTAAILYHLFFKKKGLYLIAGTLILTLLIFTNFVHIFPLNLAKDAAKEVNLQGYVGKETVDRFLNNSLSPRYYFFDFLYEITHHYESPTESVYKILAANYSRGDKIFFISDDLDWQYISLYLNVTVYPALTQEELVVLNEDYDWIIIGTISEADIKIENYVNIEKYDLFIAHNKEGYYSEAPDPVNHRFKTDKNGKILVYKKMHIRET